MVCKVDDLVPPVIPSRIGPQETVPAPGVGILSEIGFLFFREIAQGLGLEFDGIHIDLHALLESEQALLSVISSAAAFNDAAVLVLERAAILENGDTVLGIVVQARGAEGVAILVEEFHQRTAELSTAFVDPVKHLVALEHRLVLDHLDIAVRLDELGIHVPGSGIAQQIGIIVQETGMPLDKPVVHPVLLVLLGPFGLYQTEYAVLGGFSLAPGQGAAQDQQHDERTPSDAVHAI